MTESFAMRRMIWEGQRSLAEWERERAALLNAPLPKNPRELLAPTRARVLKPFYVGGRPRQAGEIVMLERHDALSLAALAKCEILSEGDSNA